MNRRRSVLSMSADPAFGEKTMFKKRTDHIVEVHPMTFICRHCGQHYAVNMPASIDIILASGGAFIKSHRSCKFDKARGLACPHCFEFGHLVDDCPRKQYAGDWRKWLNGPDTGTSSRMICNTLSPKDSRALYDVDSQFGTVPLDPSDFGRCYRLLKTIPGWRQRIGEMHDVPGWAPLVAAWDELEALYLEETVDGRGNALRLFARMQELTRLPARRKASK
jgi:hypothetical protein